MKPAFRHKILVDDQWREMTLEELRALVPAEISDEKLRDRMKRSHSLATLSLPLDEAKKRRRAAQAIHYARER